MGKVTGGSWGVNGKHVFFFVLFDAMREVNSTMSENLSENMYVQWSKSLYVSFRTLSIPGTKLFKAVSVLRENMYKTDVFRSLQSWTSTLFFVEVTADVGTILSPGM